MRAALHQRICMVIEMARNPSVFFSSPTRNKSNKVTISKLIYCFKQNQATAPSATPSGGSPVCYILHIHLIHAVGGANSSPWWGGWGLFCVSNNAKNVLFPNWISTKREFLVPAGTDLAVKLLSVLPERDE